MAEVFDNKIKFGDEVLIDLTEDTVEPELLVGGVTAHHKSGKIITGNMPNHGAASGMLSTKDAVYSIEQGYHSGEGVVYIDPAEVEKILPENIRAGVTILGTTGQHIGDLNYVHEQAIADKTWLVKHNLDKYPAVTVIDSANTVIIGDIKYIDENTLQIMFSSAFTGRAYCN